MGALDRCYEAPCRWYPGGPVGKVRFYKVPATNKILPGNIAVFPLRATISEYPPGDDGRVGEIRIPGRKVVRGTNFRPDLDGSHPFGTPADFAGLTPLPVAQPPAPDCAQAPGVSVAFLWEGGRAPPPPPPMVSGGGSWGNGHSAFPYRDFLYAIGGSMDYSGTEWNVGYVLRSTGGSWGNSTGFTPSGATMASAGGSWGDGASAMATGTTMTSTGGSWGAGASTMATGATLTSAGGSWGNGGATMALILLADEFNDLPGTGLDVHTMDAGPGWILSYAVFTIGTSDVVFSVTGSNAYVFASTDAGRADYTLTVTVRADVAGDPVGAVFRFAPGGDWIAVSLNDSADGFQLLERVGGSVSYLIYDTYPFALSVDHVLQLVIVGAQVDIYLDGALAFSYPSLTGTTNTGCGLFSTDTGSGTQVWKHFQVKA